MDGLDDGLKRLVGSCETVGDKVEGLSDGVFYREEIKVNKNKCFVLKLYRDVMLASLTADGLLDGSYNIERILPA